MKIKKIAVGPIQTNCYILTDEKSGKAAVIDPGFFSSELKFEIDEIGNKNIEYILLTHGHWDHVGGADKLRDYTDARVAVSEKDSELMKMPKKNGGELFEFALFTCSHADIILNDGDVLNLGNTEIKVISTPGHTAGGISLLTKDVLFAGDTMFFENCGRCDLYSSDVKQMIDSLNKLAKLPPQTRVFPGHGQETSIGHELLKNPYIGEDVYDRFFD